jgi:hemerythrin superfamily protein
MHTDTHAGTSHTGDIYQLLKRDHELVSGILDEIEGTPPGEDRRLEDLFARLVRAVEAHSQAEEDVFYGVLEQEEALADRIEDARQEHDDVDEMLEEIDELSPSDPDWMDRIQELRQLIVRHVEEEEGELFARAREILDPAEASRLGQEFLRAKQMAGEVQSGERRIPSVVGDVGRAERDEIEQMSKRELYELARQRHIEGRSAMTKSELVEAIRASR